MPTPCSAIHVCVSAGLLLATDLGGWALSATTATDVQAESSAAPQGAGPGSSTPAETGTPAARDLFQKHCVKCHGADGRSGPVRTQEPTAPDFTKAEWHSHRDQQRLASSILNGRGRVMPPFRGKINNEQAHALVAYVRSFARGAGHAEQKGTTATEFARRFDRLEEQMKTLEARYHKVSKAPPDGAPSKSSESGEHKVARSSDASTSKTESARNLFEKRCAKCHGANGTGSAGRDRLPTIPNFTKASWQARRTDAQLMASILDGRGDDMPSWRGKISREQAHGLVAYVRSLTPGRRKDHQNDSPSAEPKDTEPPRDHFAQVLRWIGKFHPPAVHFPIALLVAAAVAEVLRMTTGKAAYGAVTQYCVRFGAVTAMIAGALGWCLAGFRASDASWIMMTHRWLGTSVVGCAVLLLALSEASRRPAGRAASIWFRLTLLLVVALVSVAGFFGGALVFGLDHFAWPHRVTG